MTQHIKALPEAPADPATPREWLIEPPPVPQRRVNFMVDEPVYQKFATLAAAQGRTLSGVIRQMMHDWTRHQSGKEVVHVDGGRCPFDYVNKLRRD